MSHATNTDLIKRLKRAEGHLRSTISMIENGRSCLDIAQQLQAIESAVGNAKKFMVQDHIDHCLEDALRDDGKTVEETISEFKAVTKYL